MTLEYRQDWPYFGSQHFDTAQSVPTNELKALRLSQVRLGSSTRASRKNCSTSSQITRVTTAMLRDPKQFCLGHLVCHFIHHFVCHRTLRFHTLPYTSYCHNSSVEALRCSSASSMLRATATRLDIAQRTSRKRSSEICTRLICHPHTSYRCYGPKKRQETNWSHLSIFKSFKPSAHALSTGLKAWI